MDSPPPSLGAVECRHFPPSFSTRGKEKKEEEKCLFCTSGVRAKGGPEFFFSLSRKTRADIDRLSHSTSRIYCIIFIYARYIPPPHHLNYNSVGILPPPSKHQTLPGAHLINIHAWRGKASGKGARERSPLTDRPTPDSPNKY